ncbi:hypothetical protein COOONC_23131 [Cooperia oncophora]
MLLDVTCFSKWKILRGVQLGRADLTFQDTGSFKGRSARNVLSRLSEKERKSGVFAGSAGNFARAIAFHGQDLGIPVTVVLPRYGTLKTIAGL